MDGLAVGTPPAATHDRRASDLDQALLRFLEKVDAAKQRALARAGWTEQDDDFGGVYGEIDALEHLKVAEPLVESLHSDEDVTG
jgi:hypothetical protein